VKNLEAQEERLRELMSEAENVTEIMEIERELTRIRSEIDNLKMNLSDIDDRASMSTIHLGVREIEDEGRIQPVDENIWSEAKESFTRSINRMINFMENTFISFVGFIPVLAVLILAVFIVWIIIKKIFKKK
jgi:predicted  nucleic acid-binding Zn-ribbon protein